MKYKPQTYLNEGFSLTAQILNKEDPSLAIEERRRA